MPCIFQYAACDLVGQIRPGNVDENNGSCVIVNLTNINVCESDGWRELCDGHLSDKDAQVICRELGYSDVGRYMGAKCNGIVCRISMRIN